MTTVKKFLAEITADRDIMREDYREATARINEIGELVTQTEQDIATIGEQLAELPKLQSQAGGLQRQVDDTIAAQSRLDEAQAGLQAVASTLEKRRLCPRTTPANRRIGCRTRGDWL